jgi:hypothetical protein
MERGDDVAAFELERFKFVVSMPHHAGNRHRDAA